MAMHIDKMKVRRHFDRHAHEYDTYADIQLQMAERLLRLITERKPPERVERIIEIGCGTGLLTEGLLRLYPHAQVLALDLSPRMAEHMLARLGPSAGKRLMVRVCDAERLTEGLLPWRGGADLIVSNAAVQWFDRPERTLPVWVRRLRGDGLLAFATFGPQTFRELHDAFASAERALGLPLGRHGQAFLDLTVWKDVLLGQDRRLRFGGEETLDIRRFANVRRFLESIKRVGAGNAMKADQGRSGGTSRSLFQSMEQIYASRYASGAGIAATYHLLYAWVNRE